MKINSSAITDESNDDKIEYEPPILETIEMPQGLIVTGGSNIYDDLNHQYSPDNDD